MAKLERDLVTSIQKLINERNGQIKWLDDFISTMRGHEVGVNTAKTATTVGTVAGTIMLFTPLAPAGVATLVVSGVGGLGTCAGDLIANKVKDGSIQEVAKRSEAAERDVQACLAKVNKMAEGIRKMCACTEEESVAVVLSILKGLGGLQGEAHKLWQSLPFVTNVLAALRAGASIKSATDLAVTTTTVVSNGARASVAMGEGIAASAEGAALMGKAVAPAEGLVAAGASTLSKLAVGVAVFGAVVSVGDCIYSWATNNPTKESAIQIREKLRESRQGLQELLSVIN